MGDKPRILSLQYNKGDNTLKRFMLVLVSLALLCGVAFAQEDAQPEQTLQYELDDGASMLTVTLPANATTGFEWTCTLSEDGLVVEEAHEYIPDDEEDLVGSGGVSVYTFSSAMKDSGLVTLTFLYAQPWEGVAADAYEVDVQVDEANLLSVEAVRQLEPGMVTVAWRVGAKVDCPECGNPDAEIVEVIDGGDEEGGVFWTLTLDCPDCGPVEWWPET